MNLTAARAMLNEAAGLFELEEDGYFRFYSDNELVSMLENAGFKNITVTSSWASLNKLSSLPEKNINHEDYRYVFQSLNTWGDHPAYIELLPDNSAVYTSAEKLMERINDTENF
jgi:hypothetical protein